MAATLETSRSGALKSAEILPPLTDRERERLASLADVQLEEWSGGGHFVHLVDPHRFATRLRQFVDHCTATDRGSDDNKAPDASASDSG